MDSGWQGDDAENIVRLWCRKYGAVANKSRDQDSTGWDLHVEVPPVHTTESVSDKRPTWRTVYVQVKSTKSAKPYADIPFSHWGHVIYRDGPFFYVFLVYDSCSEVSQVYVTHVGQHWIGRALKRQWELEKKVGSKPNLSKRTLRVRPTPEDALSVPFDRSFLERVRNHNLESQGAYAAWKQRVREKEGVPEKPIRVDTRIAVNPDTLKNFSDWMLGYVAHFEADLVSFSAWKSRFGIELPIVPHESTSAGKIRISLPDTFKGTPVFLVARSGGKRSARVAAHMRSNIGGMFRLPDENHIYRIYTRCIELRWSPGIKAVELTYTFDLDSDSIDVCELGREAGLLLIAFEPGGRLHVSSADSPSEEWRTFDISRAGIPHTDRALLGTLANANLILRHFDIDDIRMSLGELRKSAAAMRVLVAVLAPTMSGGGIPREEDGVSISIGGLTIEGAAADAEKLVGEETGVVLPVVLRGTHVTLIVWLVGIGTIQAGRTNDIYVPLTMSILDVWNRPADASILQLMTEGIGRVENELEVTYPNIKLIETPGYLLPNVDKTNMT